MASKMALSRSRIVEFFKKKAISTCFGLVWMLSCLGCSHVHAQWDLDFETGFVFSGYNDVRIPGDSGTPISLSEELDTEPALFFRGQVSYTIRGKHTLALLVAPLRLRGEGRVDRPVTFYGEEFPANTPLKSRYRFDSYRLTYRYDVYRGEVLTFGLGVTAKVRDASICLEGDDKKAEKKNTGFVPLINFKGQWMFTDKIILILHGDALAAPQGRAEDVLVALCYMPSRTIGLKFGYRILEGGADNDEVYNFTLLNYIATGVSLSF